MKTYLANLCFQGIAALLVIVLGSQLAIGDTTLLIDNFDGTHGTAADHPGGVVDTSTYRAPFGGTTGDDFVGRTNFRFTLPADGVATSLVGGATGSTDGKVAVLSLDTFNPNAAGMSFLGQDVLTKSNYIVGGGLRMTTRMRVVGPIPGGMVAAPFLYDTTRSVGAPPVLVRDEIDHELLTNNAQSAPPDNTLTNVWNDGTFASPGSPVLISNPSGFDITQFHDYRTDWTPTSVKYYIDNTLVRTETTTVPNDPMRAHVNFWAPDSTFAAAYNAGLTPSATGPGTTYKVEVDKLQIDRFNTNVSGNLLADPSFENFGGTPDSHDVGGWVIFNNAFIVSNNEVPFQTPNDLEQLKVFGHFIGKTDASGAFQNVPAAPGQQFEGSIWAYSPSFDSIKGNQNYTNITLQFCDANNAVIGSVAFSPGTNQKDTPIYDGRDTNIIQDQWTQYSVDAVAPANTAYVRFNAFFIQLYHVIGDYNQDGIVDAADYTVWRDHLGQTFALQNRDPANTGAIGAADYTTWKNKFGQSGGVGDGGAVYFDNASLVQLTASSGASSASAAPEPTSLCLMSFAIASLGLFRRRGR